MRVRFNATGLREMHALLSESRRSFPTRSHQTALLIERALENLAENPLMGRPGRAPGTRELVLRKVPYIIVYRVTDDLEVIPVIHASRRWPDKFEQ